MSDENEPEIDLELEQSDEVPPHVDVLEPESIVRAGVGMKTVLVLSVLAALTGAFGGAAISQAFNLKSPGDDKVRSQLESFSQDKDTLRREVSQLEDTVNSLKTQKSVDLTPLKTRLKDLELRNSEQEKRINVPGDADGNSSAYADIGARVEALENSPATQQSGNVLPDDILGRLEALEKQGPNTDLNEIADRLDRLEVQSLKKAPQAAVAVAPVKTVIIPPFPKDAVLEVAASSGQGNWLNRALDKHVQIRDADEASPAALVDQIQTHLDAGEYSEALAIFDTLPSKSRSAGKAWRDAVAANIKVNP